MFWRPGGTLTGPAYRAPLSTAYEVSQILCIQHQPYEGANELLALSRPSATSPAGFSVGCTGWIGFSHQHSYNPQLQAANL